MPKKKMTQAEYMKEHKVGFARLDLDMNHLPPTSPQSVSALGVVKMRGPVDARTADNLVDAYSRGSKHELNKLESMLFDILDGCKGPGEIKYNTGLSDERCQEIYAWYTGIPKEMVSR